MAVLLDIVKKGSTDRSVCLRIIDSTDGTPETAVVFNTSGIALWYRREGAAVTQITEATLAALTTAHTDGGFLHVSDGEYRLDLPDAAYATGANYVDVGGTVTGMIVIGGRVRLVDYDPEDTVRLGLTALPNVASGNAGALIVAGTGTAALNVSGGRGDADALRINGNATSAANLQKSTSLIVTGTVTNAALSPSTTQFECSDITTATADFYVGRRVIGLTGNRTNEAAQITAYSLQSGRGRFTVTTMTGVFANGDTLIIV